MSEKEVIIIGGGPAGLAAAIELYNQGIKDILILEREKELGGILRQCIHDGFGLTRFGVSLSGPEYAKRFIEQVEQLQIPYMTNATVVELTEDKVVTVATRGSLSKYRAKAIILTMGCRERTRGALGIPGERPTGVYTAGVAQAYMNVYNRMPGKEVVILGSGDIGMIMARRMTLEGAHVQAVFEIQSIPSGLPRNIQQCLNDYDIPLYLNHTVTEIHGKSRLEAVTVSKVDNNMRPIPGTEQTYKCDTLILSVGLIPENELSLDANVKMDGRTKGACVDEYFQTSVNGIFAAGNVLHVHDLVDFVSMEAEKLAAGVARYLTEGGLPVCDITVTTDENINHTVPQKVSGNADLQLAMRVRRKLDNVTIIVRQGNKVIKTKKMKKIIPAEMIHLSLKESDINGAENLEVSVEC